MDFLKELKLGLKSLLLQRNPGKTDIIFEIIQTASELKKNKKSIEQYNFLFGQPFFVSQP